VRSESERTYVTELKAKLQKLAAPPEDFELAREDRSLLVGLIATKPVLESLDKAVGQVRSGLLSRLESSGLMNASLQRALSLEPPTPPPAPAAAMSVLENRDILAAYRDRIDKVNRGRLRLLVDCFCRNIIPPCQPCEDLGVLLACFTWDDCQVKDLCVLERRFVLTWPTLRYWVPFIGQLGEALEMGCCPSKCEDTARASSRTAYMAGLSNVTSMGSLVGLYLYLLRTLCLRDKRTVKEGAPEAGMRTIIQGLTAVAPPEFSFSRLFERPGIEVAAEIKAQETTLGREQFDRAFEAALERPEFVEKLKQRLSA
jgi:hypothetical protein